MTKDKKIEEPEIVKEPAGQQSYEGFKNAAYGFAKDTAEQSRDQALWMGWLVMFVIGFIALGVFALIVSILFWLLPFVFAVFIALAIIGGVAYIGDMLYKMIFRR